MTFLSFIKLLKLAFLNLILFLTTLATHTHHSRSLLIILILQTLRKSSKMVFPNEGKWAENWKVRNTTRGKIFIILKFGWQFQQKEKYNEKWINQNPYI